MSHVKKGLDYFPFDIDFFDDMKIRKLIRDQGSKAIPVYTYLLCSIYKNGYYLVWDKDTPFVISEKLGQGCKEVYVAEVLKSCLTYGLFSQALFEKHSILTSRGIQERYNEVVQRLKRTAQIEKFKLIQTSEECRDYSEECTQTSEECGDYSEECTQTSEFSPTRQKKGKGKEALPRVRVGLSEFNSFASELGISQSVQSELFNYLNENDFTLPSGKPINSWKKFLRSRWRDLLKEIRASYAPLPPAPPKPEKEWSPDDIDPDLKAFIERKKQRND